MARILDVTSVDRPDVTLTVLLKDLNAPEAPQVVKTISFAVVGAGLETSGRSSE